MNQQPTGNAITFTPSRLATMRQVVVQYQREMEQNKRQINSTSKPTGRPDLTAISPRPMTVLLAVLQSI